MFIMVKIYGLYKVARRSLQIVIDLLSSGQIPVPASYDVSIKLCVLQITAFKCINLSFKIS